MNQQFQTQQNPSEKPAYTAKDYAYGKSTWCPGCGDFGVLAAMHRAAAELGIDPHMLTIVTGIGCSARVNEYFMAYAIHAIHGRVLPIATAVKLANPELTVIGASGDGDAYAIGGNHFVHTVRRNPNITYLVLDNQIYALTKGQSSPTSDTGFVTVSSPYGTPERPFNPLRATIALGGTFVARGFSGDLKGLTELIIAGIQHRGLSLIHIFSPCPTVNRINTFDWYRQRVYPISDIKGYDPSDRMQAFALIEKSAEEQKFPLGIIYKREGVPTLEDMYVPKDSIPARRDWSKDLPGYQKLLDEYLSESSAFVGDSRLAPE